MNLRKNEIELHFIATQLLDECPSERSSAFQDGFLDLVQTYFLHLDCCSAPFKNNDGSFYVDLNYVSESSFDVMEVLAAKMPIAQTKDYWQGAMTAFPLAEMKIKLAYEFDCESEAA